MGHRLLLTAIIVFIGTSILASVMQGGGGIVSTILTEDVEADAMVLPVYSTSLFNDADVIRVGNEKIMYSSKNATAFFIYERGYEDTDPEAFDAGRRVYSTEAGVLNDAFGYNLGVSVETGGMWGIVMLPVNFFLHTLPHLAVLNANLFKIPELAIIPICWYGFGIALLVIIAIQVAPIAVTALTGIAGLILRR
jgi:hypothetical protein